MSSAKTAITISFFIAIFLLQESLINQIDFFLGGFSLYLALLFSWIVSEERSGMFLSAFIGGILLDFTPTLDTPVGLWTFTLLVIAYAISRFQDELGDLDAKPITAAIYLVIATSLSATLYLIISGILGNDIPPVTTVLSELIGNSLWTLLFSPIYFPIIYRLKERIFSEQVRL
jgi:rod shape-determining protein MreD